MRLINARRAFSRRVAPRDTPETLTVQSWSFLIRDVFLNKLLTVPFFNGFTPRKSKQLQIMTQNIPYLGVYFVHEDMTADGDFDAGEIRFLHLLKLGFSVIIQNNDPAESEATLDQAFWTIMNSLWRDPYLTNMINTTPYTGIGGTPANVRINGVTRGARRHVFGNAGLNNETPIAEMQYEATVRYGADYGPIITDDLLRLNVTTGIKAGDTQAEMDQRQQINVQYQFAAAGSPFCTVAPEITGTTVEGDTLTVSQGTWANSPTSYAYQWIRDGFAISGATASTYVLVSVDVGHTIAAAVTATNSTGSVTADSGAVGPVTAQ